MAVEGHSGKASELVALAIPWGGTPLQTSFTSHQPQVQLESHLTFHQENVLTILSPVAEAKSIKNEAETEGFRQCHIRDGAALVCLLVSVAVLIDRLIDKNVYVSFWLIRRGTSHGLRSS